MAQRSNAKSGFRHELTKIIDKAYPPALIKKLWKEYRLPVDYDQWRYGIKKAAWVYLRSTERRLRPEPNSDFDGDYYGLLADAAHKLAAEMTEDRALLMVALELCSLAKANAWNPGRIGRRRAIDIAVDRCHQISEDLSSIALALDALAQRYQREPAKRGPKPDEALVHYVDYLRDYWIDGEGQRFTLDYIHGEGVSRAFKFISDCIAPIATIPPRRIITAMRKVIADRNRPPLED